MSIVAIWALGQFGTVGSSIGMDNMASWASQQGIESHVFAGTDATGAEAQLVQALQAGSKTVLVGYSEGAGLVGYLEQRHKVDFCALIDPSRDCYNYKLVSANCPDSVLFHNSNWFGYWTGLGDGGEAGDPGTVYDVNGVVQSNGDLNCRTIMEFNENHLLMDFDGTVQQYIEKKLLAL